MIDDFLYKYYNDEYISNYLFNIIKYNHREIISKDFDIDKYNEEILDKMYKKNKDYFDTLFSEVDPNIHIDYEQAKAILADEDYSLILAGAGTGKTTTMVAKVKYLVEKKKVNPSDIVVISFTKKTTEELRRRIVNEFDIPANVFTFHSLGYKYIRNYYRDKQIYIVDENLRHQIFFHYLKERIFNRRETLENLINIYKKNDDELPWLIGKFLSENYKSFNSFDEYFEAYKKNAIWEAGTNLREYVAREEQRRINGEIPRTLKGEFVKSVGEARIANFLYKNGIEYKYEKVYSKLVEDRKEYRPDFTIEFGGEPIYIEYFGLSNYDGEESKEYQKIKRIKEEYHKQNNNRFIKIDYVPKEDIIATLIEELKKYGVTLKEKSNYDIYSEILDQNPTRELFRLEDFWFDVIDTIKSSEDRDIRNEIINNFLKQQDINSSLEYESNSYFIRNFYDYYEKSLTGNPDKLGIDFNDMIYYANLCLAKDPTNFPFAYKYLIIDEYQDISLGRYILTKEIIDVNKGKIVAVGDDWQSIYGFSGSKIEYVYDFEKYFKGAKLFKISTTYRNGQSLVNYAGEFIMRNKSQIPKELVSTNDEENPIQFIEFEDEEEYLKLKELIIKIHKENPSHHILILARKNYSINKIFDDRDFKDDIGTKISIRNMNDLNLDGMSIHKSKGLTADEVIIIGLNSHFPVEGYGKYWLIELFKNKMENEQIEYAEERRVFYVALTRTKHKVYLLVNKNVNKLSPFVQELRGIVNEK